MADLIITTRVQAHLKGRCKEPDDELMEAIDEVVRERLNDAARRAEANGRQTVFARDL